MSLRSRVPLPGALMDAYEDCALNGHNFVPVSEDDENCYLECTICGWGDEL